MWRHAILTTGVVLAVLGFFHFRGGGDHKTSTPKTDSAQQASDTKGARVVHFMVGGRDEIAVVPKRSNGQLLFLLHGAGAGPEQFLTNQFFTALALTSSPTVVLLKGGEHSFWHDRSSGMWASRVLNEAIPDAVRRFHTKGKVGVGGISMGGYGALHLAALRPNEFCAVGGHSAALWRRSGATARGAFDNAEDYRLNNVFTAIGKLKKVPVWLDVGDQDPFKPADSELARKLSVVLHVYPGGHNSAYWNSHMAEYLSFYRRAC